MLTKNKVTKTDLIKYLYGEVSANEAKSVANAIAQNPILKKEYEMLKQTQKQIDTCSQTLAPSQQTLNSILNYAKNALHNKRNLAVS